MSNEVNHAPRGGAAAATQETGQATPALSFDGVVPLESVLCTDELDRRPSRPPDCEQENRALGLGRGSEFVVRLATVPAPGIEAAATPARAEERAAPGLRVLLVDDNVDSCNMLATLLEHSGHRVQAAHTGPAGLQAALAWRPDVVLLDIGLPEIDGYEVARRLRHDPVMTSTKLVALTGYGAANDLRLAREAGFDAHILKPVHLVELERLLATWVTAA